MLHEILTNKRRELASIDTHAGVTGMIGRLRGLPPTRSLKQALTESASVAIIAEIKRKSPSKGILARAVEPALLASQYESGGAGAISVLTDSRYFSGSADDLVEARSNTNLPVLRKDFIVDEFQVYESRVIGADAILLIVAALSPGELSHLHRLARDIGLEVLVEVHDEKEMEIATAAGAQIIGINNRNLKTFEISLSTTVRLSRLIPTDVVGVSESGVTCHDDIARLAALGVDAALVGEKIMTAGNPEIAIRELLGGNSDQD